MTEEASGQHPLRCETCKHNKTQPNTILYRCDLREEPISLNQSVLIDELGCASHSSAPHPAAAAEQRIKDVIAELERLAVLYHAKSEEYAETGDTALHERLWGEWLAITKAISLLRGGKP